MNRSLRVLNGLSEHARRDGDQTLAAMPLDDPNLLHILDLLHDGVYLVNRDRQIVFWNASAERISGYAGQEMVGQTCHRGQLRHVNENGECHCESGCPLAATIEHGRTMEEHVFLRHRDGHRVPVTVRVAPLFDRNGEVVGAVQVFSNDAERVADLDEVRQLQIEATIDPLTELANRRHIERALQARFADLERFRWPFGVLMVDVDGFKALNDEHGHAAGDELLRMVARTLSNACRTLDTIGRWGGDEFLVILAHVESSEVRRIGERLRTLVERSEVVQGDLTLRTTLSIGGACARIGDTVNDLLGRADSMLYRSKSRGRNCLHFAA